jgi:DNA-binding response OmpR family regulator
MFSGRQDGDPTARVLMLDDDPKLVSLLERGLAYDGFDVHTASDGSSGLTLAPKVRPHVVLVDIAMPDPDGFEVCRLLRRVHDVAIVMLTGRDDVADKVTALNLGRHCSLRVLMKRSAQPLHGRLAGEGRAVLDPEPSDRSL